MELLEEAARSDDLSRLKRVCKRARNINYEDESTGETALICATRASKGKNLGCMDFLLSTRAIKCNVQDNLYGKSALMWAAYEGYSDCVQLLVDKSADVNLLSDDGKSALSWAASCGHVSCVKKLINHRANVHQMDRFQQTALHWAAIHGSCDCIALLIRHSIDVNHRNHFAQEALIASLFQGHIAAMKLLIKYKADVNQRDNEGLPAAMWCILKDRRDCLSLLLAHQADVSSIAILNQGDPSSDSSSRMTSSACLSPLALCLQHNRRGCEMIIRHALTASSSS